MFKVARILITSFLCKNYMLFLYACQIYSAIAENRTHTIFWDESWEYRSRSLMLGEFGGKGERQEKMKYLITDAW
jgi:hypothetical protein